MSNKRGRPTKLTQAVQKKIVDAIRMGNYIETAAAYAGVNKVTLYDWLRRGQREKDRVAKNPRAKIRVKERPFVEFSNAVEKALAEAEMRDVAIIGEAAEKQWQAAAWRLERKFPARWGRRDRLQAEIEHSGKMEIEKNGTIEHRLNSDPECRELLKRLYEHYITMGSTGED
ncbi:MAG: hypothetical protein JRC86_05605 [Deltaproteobacteria bacterium]|nr:hypothetical protein [Deltaproteobacteria bacterium]